MKTFPDVIRKPWRFLKRQLAPKVSMAQFEAFVSYLPLPSSKSIYLTSSFSSFGQYLGRPTNIVSQFFSTFGDSLTLSVPGHSDPFSLNLTQLIDLRKDNFHTGEVPRSLFNSKNCSRSSHPFASTISTGPLSCIITASHDIKSTVCHSNSPLSILTARDTLIVGIGTDFSAHAFYHIIEELPNFPLYVYENLPINACYIDFAGDMVRREIYRYNRSLSAYRFERQIGCDYHSFIKSYLQEHHGLVFYVVGDAICWSISSSRLLLAMISLLDLGMSIYGPLSSTWLTPFIKL